MMRVPGSPSILTPLTQGSIGVHVSAVALALAQPRTWPWDFGAVLLNQAVLAGAGMWPTSSLLGPNLTRLPETGRAEVALTFDDGPDPDITPRVLDMLDQHRARATFFCIGTRARSFPDVVREIVRRGHAVENHTDRHLCRFAALDPLALRRELTSAQDTLAELTGSPPVFFRAPMGLRSPLLQPVLSSLNLQLASWTRRALDGAFGNPIAAYNRLQRGLKMGDVLMLHDRELTPGQNGQAVVLTVLPRLLENLALHALRSVTLREGCAGRLVGSRTERDDRRRNRRGSEPRDQT